MADTPMFQDTISYTGQNFRDALRSIVMASGTVFGSRSGIRPGDPGLNTTLAGSTISVSAGTAVIASHGVYVGVLTSAWSGTLTAAHATLTRIDLVYLRIWDTDFDSTGLRKTDVVYLAGTPSSTPVAPTPGGTEIYLPLATITVPPTGGGSPSVSTAVLPYTVAPGGILPASTAPSTPYTGQYYDNGSDLLRWNGSAWDTYFKIPGAWIPYTPVWTAPTTNPSLGNGTLIGRYQKVGRDVHFHINLTCGSTTTYGSGGYGFTLPPFTAANLGASMIGVAQLLGTNRWAGQIVISPSATGTSTFFPASQTDCRLAFHSATVPETMASGAQVRITGSYESVS
ncbi:hypothetical protein OG747_36850 [Streptomyces sp. NBC_01384]|uniref:hypothetical protein n=1 Tax=Streptomyces sp. NBC_01384 TaxID=2903847 RepID=UPI0032494D72